MSQEKEYFARFPKLMVPSPIWAVVYKATWVEGDKIIQGCWGAWVNDQRVIAYFGDDKTVALIPFSVLSKVQGV